MEANIMEWICLVFLGACSYLDIKYKMVRVRWCMGFALFSIAYQGWIRHVGWMEIISGIVLGGFVLVLSYITKEAIGRGDGILLLSVGISWGFWQGIQIFMLGLLFIMVAGVLLIFIKKVSLRERIPFVPFLFLGDAVWLIYGI